MKSRTPSIDDLAQLTRDEWEELAGALCSKIFSAHRVEDRQGKGNGLDAWRERPDGTIEGWQFKRYDDRFGTPQTKTLREGIELAVERVKAEHKSSLSRFTAVINIDLEPGHMKSKGEIERFVELADWARATHQVQVKCQGITWVRTRLLQFPHLRPDLFEDLAGSIAKVREEQRNESNNITRMIEQLLASNEVQRQLDSALSVLLREAIIHFERGNSLQLAEEYARAMTSLDDAARLGEATKDTSLTGKILALLAGVETLVGFLTNAIAHGRKAVNLLGNGDDEYALLAKGNLAFALSASQEYNEADVLFIQLLDAYELQGNLDEMLRTLIFLTEGCTQRKMLERASMYSERMLTLVTDVEIRHNGPTELTLSAMGAAANVFSMRSTIADGAFPQGHRRAIEVYQTLEKAALEAGNKRIRILSKFSRAVATWHLDDLRAAKSLFREVATEAPPDFMKVRADALFNLGLIFKEAGNVENARKSAEEARSLYREIGDLASVNDAAQFLERLRRAQ